MAVLFGVLIAVCCAKAAISTGCEGKAVNKIVEALTAVGDWEGLANELNAKRGTIDAIKTKCRVETSNLAKCYRRELVNWYCDSTGYELGDIVENIAQALEGLDHKRQATDLRALEFSGGSTPTRPPHVSHQSSTHGDKRPTQFDGEDGQHTPSLPHNIAASLWEYQLVFSTGVLAIVIGFLIFYRRKTKSRPTPPPTAPPSVPGAHPERKPPHEEEDDPLNGDDKWRDVRPTPEELTLITYHSTKKLRVIESAQEKWQEIGTLLKVPGLTSIQMQHRGNLKEQCRAVLHEWLRRGSTKYGTTWQGLLRVLVDVELNVLAKDLVIALRDQK